MEQKAFELIQEKLQAALNEQGFGEAVALEIDNGRGVMFTTGEVAYGLFYETKQRRFVLRSRFPVSLSSPFRRTKGQFRALRTQNCLLHCRGICPPGARPGGQTFFYLFRQAGAGTFSGARLFCVCPFARRQNARQRVFRAPVRRNAAVPKEDTPGDVFRHGQKRFGVENFHRKRVDFYRDAPYN